MKKLLYWIQDKYEWFKTFNTKPTVVITGNKLIRETGVPAIYMKGRVIVTYNIKETILQESINL
jgi:hypothetical protein